MEFFIQDPQKDFRNRRVKYDSRSAIEPEEVFLDRLAHKKEQEFGISEKKFEVPVSKRIFQGFYAACVLILLVLFSKTFSFQVIRSNELEKEARDNSVRLVFERPDRGVVYDSNKVQLVSNIPSFDLVLDKRDLPKDDYKKSKILEEVAKILEEDKNVLETQINLSDFSTLLISENLSHSNLLLLEPRIKDFPGFYIEKNTVRDYKLGSAFSHLLGFEGKINQIELKNYTNYSTTDYIGKTGLEKSYEKILRGNPGIIKIEKDALGREKKEDRVSSPEPGKSLVLHLDAGLQKKLADSLKNSIINVGSQKGAAVAIDPKTGGVLAMVSYPSFDNNLFSQGISQDELNRLNNNALKPMFNRAISGEYVVGSSIKPILGLAGLEEELITDKTKINDPEGKICIKNQWDPEKSECFSAIQACGIMDIYSAIAKSCNVYFYELGGGYKDFKGLGLEKIGNWLKTFGWGSLTGIDLTGEKAGFVPDTNWKENNFTKEEDKIWYLGDTYHLSIGQGFLEVTPLQVAAAISAIANNGRLFQPKIVKEIIDDNKKIVEKIEPKIINESFADAKNFDIIRKAMRDAVIYGSAAILNSLPVEAAAKTGTAQTGKKGYNHSWVTVFAPYDNPQIVLTVLVEDVREGQMAALPVAKEALEYYFAK